MDDTTGYILASHISASVSEAGAREVLLEALASTGRPCDKVVYWAARTKPADAHGHIPEEAVLKVLRDTLPGKIAIKDIEGVSLFLSGRTAAYVIGMYSANGRRCNRIKDHDNLRRYTAGWAITSNLHSKYPMLGGRTPAQAAGVKVPFANWAEVGETGSSGLSSRHRYIRCYLDPFHSTLGRTSGSTIEDVVRLCRVAPRPKPKRKMQRDGANLWRTRSPDERQLILPAHCLTKNITFKK